MPHLRITDTTGEVFEGDVEEGVTVWEACQELGCELPHSCGFGGQCSTCAVTVLKGRIGLPDDPETDLSAMDAEELETMRECNLDAEKQVLSCSSQVLGDVEVVQAGSEDGWNPLGDLFAK